MQDVASRRELIQQLKLHKRISDDPGDEVERLWTSYQAAKASEVEDER